MERTKLTFHQQKGVIFELIPNQRSPDGHTGQYPALELGISYEEVRQQTTDLMETPEGERPSAEQVGSSDTVHQSIAASTRNIQAFRGGDKEFVFPGLQQRAMRQLQGP